MDDEYDYDADVSEMRLIAMDACARLRHFHSVRLRNLYKEIIATHCAKKGQYRDMSVYLDVGDRVHEVDDVIKCATQQIMEREHAEFAKSTHDVLTYRCMIDRMVHDAIKFAESKIADIIAYYPIQSQS